MSNQSSPSNFTLLPVFDHEEHKTLSSQKRKSIASSKVTLHEDVPAAENNATSAKNNGAKEVLRLNFRQIIENEKRQGKHGGVVYNYSPNFKFGELDEQGSANNLTTLQSQYTTERPNS